MLEIYFDERKLHMLQLTKVFEHSQHNFLRSALQGDPTIAIILAKFETNPKMYIALNTLQLLYFHLQIAFDRYNNVRRVIALIALDRVSLQQRPSIEISYESFSSLIFSNAYVSTTLYTTFFSLASSQNFRLYRDRHFFCDTLAFRKTVGHDEYVTHLVF